MKGLTPCVAAAPALNPYVERTYGAYQDGWGEARRGYVEKLSA